jgi:hypothetical protein
LALLLTHSLNAETTANAGTDDNHIYNVSSDGKMGIIAEW